MKEPLKLAIAGLGTVGGGVVKVLTEEAKRIEALCGRKIEIVAVSARHRQHDRGFDIDAFRWYDDPVAMAADPDSDVFVELIGGSDGAAKLAVEQALASGKHVVTANKALIAHHGTTLARMAEENQVALQFEAAVAGGVPIIKALREGLVANGIERVSGILNGTCNYILTVMETSGREYEDVLADAQKLGYAEADPSFDVGGTDAAHKLTILASLAFGTLPDFDQVYVEGLETVTPLDIRLADDFGYKVRLLGIAQRDGKRMELRVHPTLVGKNSSLAAVTGVFNAVEVVGSHVGPVMLEGRGAGEGPTASAVVADIVDVARGNIAQPFGLPASMLEEASYKPIKDHTGAYYLRVHAVDRAGSMAEITRALAEAEVSIERIVQRKDPIPEEDNRLPVVFITHDTDEVTMQRALALLAKHKDVVDEPLLIRIEQE
ncbi:homoserine dehydrogenase [Tepidicaulis marinus]|uniref:Homoserine dehydrogenase n=1 Tax=Tepidicaulis marinus TaxID=1333998 RepID=A0A081B7R7_9HYPH|nr:homoserine dehydrogenase [Tepidicaulis marinus]GAK44085.1 homoserine dehydrogenase [Tepidicaulis marinus]